MEKNNELSISATKRKMTLEQKSLVRSIATEILNFDFNEFMRNNQPESTDYDLYIKLYYETEYYILFGEDVK